MQTTDRPSIEGQTAPLPQISAGWILKRAALWMLFVGLGVSGACLLYMAASKAEAEALTRPQAAELSLKS